MPVAEIIAIGTELLLGEIQDTNTRYLARTLRDAGIDLYRTTTIGDNADRIAQTIRESLSRADIIITTGGLGPTVDDATRQAVAQAAGVALEFQPELWDQIQARFKRWGRPPGENNRRQAFIPAGALPIENPVGTAPAFIVDTGRSVIISLPGVPTEMEVLITGTVLPYLKQKFGISTIIKALVLHTAGMGESSIDEIIGDLELQSNPTVGLAAHSGQVDVRVTVKADSTAQADQMITETSQVIRNRLGDAIYGTDDLKLEDVVGSMLLAAGLRLHLSTQGVGKSLFERVAGKPWLDEALVDTQIEPHLLPDFKVKPDLMQAIVVFDPQNMHLDVKIIWRGNVRQLSRTYAGPPQTAPRWAANLALDTIRRCLLSTSTPT